MNYTGNPRHLRARSRSTQKQYLHRQHSGPPAITEPPLLDICQTFQIQENPRFSSVASATSVISATSEVESVASSSSREERFNAKRRRLLQQEDWLGLDLAAPINVFPPSIVVLTSKIYDIRAAKEKKRLSNGPFMKPLLRPPSELEGREPPLTRAPSQLPLSPSLTSHSSTSLHPAPSIPSIQSSQHGLAFIPSRQTTPLSAQTTSISSRSSSSSVTYNNFTPWQSTASREEPTHEMNFFVPDPTDTEVNFFPRTSSMDVGTVWNLIEKRKQEDKALRIELGRGSQSGITESQQSQQSQHLSDSRDALSSSFAQTREVSPRKESATTQIECPDSSGHNNLRALSKKNASPHIPLVPTSGPITVAPERTRPNETIKCDERIENTVLSPDEPTVVQVPFVTQSDREILASNIPAIIEEDNENDSEDDGIAWF